MVVRRRKILTLKFHLKSRLRPWFAKLAILVGNKVETMTLCPEFCEQ
jgi:hypothetical protein